MSLVNKKALEPGLQFAVSFISQGISSLLPRTVPTFDQLTRQFDIRILRAILLVKSAASPPGGFQWVSHWPMIHRTRAMVLVRNQEHYHTQVGRILAVLGKRPSNQDQA
ncbi:hypothetical protein E2C01_022129 [Portunus trituberculatus]|uniref:Uncharacterized protein n=1 Tax=Portunus trituberculatus TaxID=210409 RepID=A0A5B7E6S7_PORTR|nr:hypothetical protein [Portunus trituberculatus]